MNQAAATVLQAYHGLSEDDRKELAATLAPPGGRTRNAIWLIVVIAFALVLLGSFTTLLVAMFSEFQHEPVVKPELILSVFTTVVGFLAGLLTPSPVARAERG